MYILGCGQSLTTNALKRLIDQLEKKNKLTNQKLL